MKRYFLFSDVHGDFSALLSSLDRAGFETDNENHILIGVGDYFDRGNENKQILNFLIEYKEKERFQGIYGNHDQMLDTFLTGRSDGINDFVHNGMDETLNNLSGLDSGNYMLKYPQVVIDKVIENNKNILEFLNSLEDKIVLGKYEIVHAGYTEKYESKDTEETVWLVDNWAMTPRFVKNFPANPDVIYVFGHWHAFRLNDEFLKPEYNKSGFHKNNHSTFRYKNFIGLDACTNISHFVNVLILEETESGIQEVKSE